MKKELVVKDNALINASYHLSLAEQRLVLLAIVELRNSGASPGEMLTIHTKSYIDYFNVHRNTAYEMLNDACNNLFERRFSYQKLTAKSNIEVVKNRWVTKISYVENEALVRIKFSEDIVPFITQLEKHFTSYALEQITNLTSGYAVRLYELLIAWRDKGKTPVIELEEFKNRLGVLKGGHERISNLKKVVLEPAITQINKHTDIQAEYSQHKTGRVITGFSFKFKKKKTSKASTRKIHKREIITKAQAETMAKVGETYTTLYARLAPEYVIKG